MSHYASLNCVYRHFSFGLQIACLFCAVASEAADSLGPAQEIRQLLASKEFDANHAQRLLSRLDVSKKLKGWEEAHYLAAEVCLRIDGKEHLERAEREFRLLADEAQPPWKMRGQIGLFRVRGIDPKNLASAAVQLERVLPKLTEDQDAAAVDAAFHLGCIRKSLGEIEASNKAFLHAQRMWSAVRKYWGQDFQPGLVSEEDIRNALKLLRPPSSRPLSSKPPPPEPSSTFGRAEKAKTKRQFDEAIELYTKVVQGYSVDPLAHLSRLRLAEVALLQSKIPEAKELLVNFIQDQPLGPYRAQAHLLLGDIFLEQEFRAPEAEAEYAAILTPSEYRYQKAGSRPRAHTLLVRVETGTGSAAANVTNEDPLAAEARMSADSAFRERLYDEDLPANVNTTWREVLPDGHTRLGMIEYLKGNFEEADRHFTRSFLMRPDERFGKGAPVGAILLAEQCRMKRSVLPDFYLRMGDSRPTVCLFLASAYLTAWQHQKAIVLFKRVADGEFNEANTEQKGYALSQYGEAVWYLGKGDEARNAWGKFLNPPYSGLREAPSALLSYACTIYTKTQDRKWIPLFERVYRQYPQSEWAPHAMLQHFNLLIDNEPEAALRLMTDLGRRYPDYRKKIPYEAYIEQSTARAEEFRKDAAR